MKIALLTLGCPKNTVDSEYVQGVLTQAGHEIVAEVVEDETVDAAIINTCGFIQSAKEEAIETIFTAIQLKKEQRCNKVIVTGCLINRYQDELRQEIPEVDAFIANHDLPAMIKELSRSLKITTDCARLHRSLLTPAHYAYLKIAEGCDNRCSYCAIPQIRGPHRSRAFDEIVAEAHQLIENGVRELIVIAQDITNYGSDLSEGETLPRLIRELVRIDSLKWLRLMYAHPAHFSDELIELMAHEEKICKYIDLPIQHISDRILKQMRRKTNRKQIESLIQKLRDQIPNLAIRTSLIVGFPGETRQDFEELLDFVINTKFERLGTFAYSPEEGTRAFEFSNPVDPQVQEERREMVMIEQTEISTHRNLSLVGTTSEVILDEYDPSTQRFIARTQWDAPEVDNMIWLKEHPQLKVGDFRQVKIVQAYEFDLDAEFV